MSRLTVIWSRRRESLAGQGLCVVDMSPTVFNVSAGALLTEALRHLLSKLMVLGPEPGDLVEGGFEPPS